MGLRFVKMHGAGNDFVLFNLLEQHLPQPPAEMAKKICDRHFGVGADGILLVLPSDPYDYTMQTFNADGSEAEMCGNGIRCFAKYVFERGMIKKKKIHVETKAGLIIPEVITDPKNDAVVTHVKVNMGTPRLLKGEIPMKGAADENAQYVSISVDGKTYTVSCTSMGNPHCILFVDDVKTAPVTTLGPKIEHHELFPKRTNVEFAQIVNDSHINLRVWERGAGETLACGTGACAAAVISMLKNKVNNNVTVSLPGGDLQISWQNGGDVFMTGPVEKVCDGELP